MDHLDRSVDFDHGFEQFVIEEVVKELELYFTMSWKYNYFATLGCAFNIGSGTLNNN